MPIDLGPQVLLESTTTPFSCAMFLMSVRMSSAKDCQPPSPSPYALTCVSTPSEEISMPAQQCVGLGNHQRRLPARQLAGYQYESGTIRPGERGGVSLVAAGR
jgi:hypothetical protein